MSLRQYKRLRRDLGLPSDPSDALKALDKQIIFANEDRILHWLQHPSPEQHRQPTSRLNVPKTKSKDSLVRGKETQTRYPLRHTAQRKLFTQRLMWGVPSRRRKKTKEQKSSSISFSTAEGYGGSQIRTHSVADFMRSFTAQSEVGNDSERDRTQAQGLS